jgi:hypothetical protein
LPNMSRKARTLRRSIFIASEGETEEKYFSAIGEEINSSPEFWVKVKTLEIEEGTRQDPLGLVQEALRVRDEEGHDEAWAVFDRDREPNLTVRQQAFDFANTHNIRIAYSSIAFEHWVLLHFERNSTAFIRSDCESRNEACTCNGSVCVCTYLRGKHYPTYKKGSYRLYSELRSLNTAAIENCAWLKFKSRTWLSPQLSIQSPYDLNPYTDIDNLLKMLFGHEHVLFSTINVNQNLSQLDVTVTAFSDNTAKLRITNNRQVTFVINNSSYFKVMDSGRQTYSHNLRSPIQISPGQTSHIELTFDGIPQAMGLEFRVRDSGLLLVIPV